MSGPFSADADEQFRKLRLEGRIFVVPEYRFVYVKLHKNACTSVLWTIADLLGEDPAAISPGLGKHVYLEDAIHDTDLWQHSPTLAAVPAALRDQIHPENGWFVFAIVRDPRSRLFSAWQDKLLLENLGYTQRRDQPWYPRHPLSRQTVLEDFATFVDAAVASPNFTMLRDSHFRLQTLMLQEDVIPYSKIYDIRQMSLMHRDLTAHLEAQGWTGELSLPRSNNTPLRANAAVFADGVRENVEKIYAADFERFGDWWDFSRIENAPEWTKHEIAEAEVRAALGSRLGDLRELALQHQRAAQRLRRELQAATKAQSRSKHEYSARRVVRGVRRRVRNKLAEVRARRAARG